MRELASGSGRVAGNLARCLKTDQGSQLLRQPTVSYIIEYIVVVFPSKHRKQFDKCQPSPVFNSSRLAVLTAATLAFTDNALTHP
jgi:hypothetical protein